VTTSDIYGDYSLEPKDETAKPLEGGRTS